MCCTRAPKIPGTISGQVYLGNKFLSKRKESPSLKLADKCVINCHSVFIYTDILLSMKMKIRLNMLSLFGT